MRLRFDLIIVALVLLSKVFNNMLRFRCKHSPSPAAQECGGFTLIEVMVAVSIAAGVISLLVPALLRQVATGEDTNRLSAVEAAVSSDLEWFSNYAKIWKLKSGSYPTLGRTPLTQAITKTSSQYTSGGAALYEPSPGGCATGLATPFLADAQQLYSLTPTISTKPYLPPNAIDITTPTPINASSGSISKLNVMRTLAATGNIIRINYYTTANINSSSFNFSREASVLVEASAWCDRLP